MINQDELREAIAEELFDEDWDEENRFATSNATNGNWAEQTDAWFRDHYYRRAKLIMSLLARSNVAIVKEVEIPHFWSPAPHYADVGYDHRRQMYWWCNHCEQHKFQNEKPEPGKCHKEVQVERIK